MRSGRAPMVGRSGELDELRRALGAVGHGSFEAVVVSGEAGIGKSRLIHEFVEEAERDSLVLVGECADSGSGPVPFAASTGIFRTLRRVLAEDPALAEEADVARLAEVIGGGAESAGDRLLPIVGNGFEALARRRRLVVVIEDLHWVDGGTLDIVRYVLTSLRDIPMLVVLTVRSDDVGRQHPLRPVLAEFDRARLATRIDLERLDETQTVALASALVGRALDAGEVAAIVERGDGVPFFVEEVADSLEGGIPSTLRDLLLVRYSGLAEEVQAVLRAIAAGGSAVSQDVLAAVVGLDETELEAAIRRALDAQVIVADGVGYRFRHALMGEAIEGEILPGEGRRLHSRYAEALEAAAPTVQHLAEAASHWWVARDFGRAFAAAVHALPAAAAARASSTAAELGERALDLWDEVEDPETVAGMSRARLLRQTADALRDSGAFSRSKSFATRAVEAWPSDDPVGAAEAAALLAELRTDLGEEGAVAVADAALAALPAGVATRAEARLLLVKARAHMLYSQASRGIETATAAYEAALRVDDRPLASNAINLRACCRNLVGDLGGFDDFELAWQLAGDDPVARTRYFINLSDAYMRIGDYARALEIADEGIEVAKRTGQTPAWNSRVVGNAVESLIWLGDWQRAEERLEEALRRLEPSTFTASLREYQFFLLIWQGRLDEAESFLRANRTLFDRISASESQLLLPLLDDEMRLLIARGRAAEAVTIAEQVLDGTYDEDASFLLPMLATAGRALADAGAGAEERTAIRAAVERLSAWSTYPFWSAVFLAEIGEGDWEAVIAGTGPARIRPYARVRLARQLIEAGERQAAAEQVATAIEEAARLGAGLILAEAEALRDAAGLGAVASRTAEPDALSPREQQVLDLIAEGLTNGQIAQRLFISQKTVSIHVSAVLRKLGVASRIEAAVKAQAAAS